MNSYSELYETKFLSMLSSLNERPGVFLGKPSLEKLLDFMFGYTFAMQRLVDYQPIFWENFNQFLFEKYHISEFPLSLCAFLMQGKSEEEGFATFFQELDQFCSTTGYPKNMSK